MNGESEDRRRLERWFSEGRLLRPDPDLPSSVDLARALFTRMGADLPLGPAARELHDRIGPADHYIIVLIDGFGYDALSRCPPDGAIHRHVAVETRAVFPSTTAAALTSLATAEYPCRHGVTGWWMYLRDRGICVTSLPFVERFEERDLREMGIAPEEIYPCPSVLPRLRHSPLSLVPAVHAQGGFARYSAGHTPIAGYREAAQAFDQAERRVESATGPTYTSIYLPHIDELAHDRGLDIEEVDAVLRAFDARIGRLLQRVGGRARVIVTGDHGHVPLAADRVLTLADDHPISRMLACPPVGEATVPFFYLDGLDGADEEEFRRAFRAEFGTGAFALISRAEAEEMRLFGPDELAPAAHDRVGDLIGIAPEPTVLYSGVRAREAPDRSVHAGLTPGEVRVPVALG